MNKKRAKTVLTSQHRTKHFFSKPSTVSDTELFYTPKPSLYNYSIQFQEPSTTTTKIRVLPEAMSVCMGLGIKPGHW